VLGASCSVLGAYPAAAPRCAEAADLRPSMFVHGES